MSVKRATPLPVKRALRKLGQDICYARKRRRIPMELAAERAGISRSTLGKIERGEGGVSIEGYARVLFILGLTQQLSNLVDMGSDRLGLELETEKLPKRVRIPKEKR